MPCFEKLFSGEGVNIAQDKHLKLDRHLLEIAQYFRLSIAPPLKMYSKFVLPNWALFGHIPK